MLWVKIPVPDGDIAIVSNRLGKKGTAGGLSIRASRNSEFSTAAYSLVYGRKDGGTTELGPFVLAPNQWVMLAVSADSEGIVRFANGGADGRFYFMAEHSPDAKFSPGNVPLVLGQDGDFGMPYSMDGMIDDMAVWNRALSMDELRSIYESGRRGICLGEMMTQSGVSSANPSNGKAGL